MNAYYPEPLGLFHGPVHSISLALFSMAEPNSDPSPEFDIDLNKQDKDSDIDHPTKKKPQIDNPDKEESPHPDTNKYSWNTTIE